MPTIVYDNSIYCAIEKCAITRLISYFGTTYRQETGEQIFYPAVETFNSNVPLWKVKNKYDKKIFTFIRNPFDRIVSNYFFNRGPWKRKFGEWPSFDEYILNMEYWNVVPSLITYLNIEVDFIGRYETFKYDFDRLHEYLGIEIKYTDGKHPLDRVENQSRRKKHYREYYTVRTRKVIEEKYKLDLERFGYEF